jgi:hypothetical protein
MPAAQKKSLAGLFSSKCEITSWNNSKRLGSDNLLTDLAKESIGYTVRVKVSEDGDTIGK